MHQGQDDQVEQGFFRREAVEAMTTQPLGSVRLATQISHQAWTLAALVIAICIVIWLFVGHYTRREHVTGSLVPQSGLVTVTARSAGTVSAISVIEGTVVHAGDRLITLSGERSSAAMGDTSAKIILQLGQQQARLRSDLVDTQSLADEQAHDMRIQQSLLQHQIEELNGQSSLAKQQVVDLSTMLNRLQTMSTKGYVSALDVQQQRNQLMDEEQQLKALARQRYESEQQLATNSDQLTQLPLNTSAKLNELRRQIAQNEQALAQNETDRESVLIAPESGVVSALLIKPGQSVSANQPLLAIVPQGSLLQAQLLVPSSAIGFVHVGTKVVLHYQAFPYQKFGAHRGIVASVSRSALTPEEITTLLGQQSSQEALYQVQVELPAQQIETYGRLEPLKPGMTLDADLLLDRRRVIEWIFEPLYGIAHRVESIN